MAAISSACGDLRERVEILTCGQNADGTEMAWRSERSVWANVQPSTGRTIFSTAGLSAPGVEILLRWQPLERTQAIRWRGRHVYITDIKPDADADFAKFEGRYFSTPKKMGAQTAEANINAGIAAAKQINAYFKDGCTKFQVNK